MTTPLKERTFESDENIKLPKPFIMRRFHSFLGFWLVLYLTEHLLVNSQAALFFQDDGSGFVAAVNHIHSLPYLQVIEVVFLGLPFLIHGIWGIYYAWTAKLNAHSTNGTKPALPQYKRNRAFSWQRITSWLLLVGILAHVIHMRVLNYPIHTQEGDEASYIVRLGYDQGLPLVAHKLNVKLFNTAQLQEMEQMTEKQEWLHSAMEKKLKSDQVLAVSSNAGGAFFLIVREAFKNPILVVLYSLLVICAAFHAFNGLWTLCIKWGITLTRRSQMRMRTLTTVLMLIVMFLGLMSAWGTYLTTRLQGI